MIRFERAGMQSLIVDQGRLGFQHTGVTEGGPADQTSCLWANRLCGNTGILPSVEILGKDVVFTAMNACNIAITGGISSLQINQQEVSFEHNHLLREGDEVTLAANDFGLRSYLATSNGFDVSPVFGSCTTVTRDKLGGLDGKGSKLNDGEQLGCAELSAKPVSRTLPLALRSQSKQQLTLRLITGYQFNDFSGVQRQQFFSRIFTLSAQSNRMAVRLEGDPIATTKNNLYSEGITRGAVQLPPEGLPIIMLNDRQTVGGYPKLGSVLSIDCDALAQCFAGTSVSFEPINIQQAHNILLLHRAKHQRWCAALDGVSE